MTDTPLDLDAILARHKPAHVLGGGAEDYCAECMRLYPCDAVTALHALRDAQARAEKAEAQVAAVLALCDGAYPEQRADHFAQRVREVIAAVDGAS